MSDDNLPQPGEDAADEDVIENALNFDTGQFKSIGSDHFDPFDDHNFRPPLPQEDRVWRHPSEVASKSDRPQVSRSALALVGVGSGIIGASLAIVALLAFRPAENTVIERVAEPITAAPGQNATNIGVDVVNISNTVRPAIVLVSVQGPQGLSSGSGVMFRSDGHLLTNAHVIEGATAVRITTQDGQTYPATIVGEDPLTDIAVLKVDMDGAPVAVLGTAKSLQVGEWAVAIGSPLGLQGGSTVTLGVVSALGRELEPGDDGVRLYDLIQTDAPIAPGSSGGALLDATGAVIGITTAIAVSDVGAEGLGFATPIDIAHRVALQLIESGEVSHAWIGITGGNPDPETLESLGINGGVQVAEILPVGPSAALELQAGDVIIGIDGKDVDTMTELILRLRDLLPGETTDLVYLTPNGEEVTEPLTLGKRPSAEELSEFTSTTGPTPTTVEDTTTTES